MRESKMDRWVQTLSLTAMVAVALSLLGAGLVLYSPATEAAVGPAPLSVDAQAQGR